MSVILDLVHEFDATVWQTLPPLPAPRSTVLLTWTVTPAPTDAGIPDRVAHIFTEALCSIGLVVYAGDQQSHGSRWTQDIAIRRGARRSKLALFLADSAAQLLPAFSTATHDWSMNAQWLVVVDSGDQVKEIAVVAKQLYEDWTIPDRWPSEVIMIVQAAVDGDGAACHSVSREVERKFVGALRAVGQLEGVELRIDPAG